jgi:hypothetical protein
MPFSKQNRRWFLGLTLTCVGLFAPSRDGIQAVAADPVTAQNLKQKIISAKRQRTIKPSQPITASKLPRPKSRSRSIKRWRKLTERQASEPLQKLPTLLVAESLTAMAKEHEAMAANIK